MTIGSSHKELFSGKEDLSSKIENQRISFDNECKFLIFAVFKNHQDVDDILENWPYMSRKYPKLGNELESILASYWSACVKILIDCQESAIELRQRVSTLIEDHENANDEHLRGNWREPSTGKMIGNLLQVTQTLRHSIDMLRAICWVALPTRQQHMLENPCTEDMRRSTDRGAATNRGQPEWARQAPQVLYETISKVWRCDRHDSHSLIISLGDGTARTGYKSLLHFKIAMTCAHSVRRYSVTVQKEVLCRLQDIREEQLLGGHREARRSQLDIGKFSSNLCPWHDLGPLPDLTCREMRDLSLERDVCHYMLDSPSATRSDQDLKHSCLGYLTTEIGLRFVFAHTAEPSNNAPRLESLGSLFVRANLEGRAIPIEAKLRTAALVAAGSLKLHDTPWFPQMWSCENLYCLFNQLDDWEDSLEDPYLQAELLKSTDQRPSIDNPPTTGASMFYCLAVVLIELAFSARWRDLQPQEYLTRDLSSWEKDLLTMAHLSRTVARALGPRYAKVVRICLFHGCRPMQSVSKDQFHRIVSEYVVKELQEIVSTVSFSEGM